MFRLFYILSLVLKYIFFYYYLSIFNVQLKPKPKIVKQFFEEAGGAFVKFGQLLGLRVDVLPREYVLEMLDLYDQVKPFPYREVERIFLNELGAKPEQIFQRFEKTPFASASFGQVHAAKLLNGEVVIVKVQRPGIREAIAIDFFIITILAFFADLFFKIEALPWREFAKEFKDWTKKELDYQTEAENTQKIYDNVIKAPETGVVIPKTYHRYTTKKILVQEYIDGIPLSNVLRETERGSLTAQKLNKMGINIKKVPFTLVTEMTRQYFLDGTFHADPHPGNILLLENDKIGLIDFGIIGEAAPKRRVFMRFVNSMANDQYDKAGYYFLEFAGSHLEQIISSALPATIDKKHIDNLMNELANHFAQHCEEVEIKAKKDINELKTDHMALALHLMRYTQRYNIKMPIQMVKFFRALSIIGFLAKELNREYRLTDVVLNFSTKYPENVIPKVANGIRPSKRIHRELAIEQLNNWLMYLAEIDPELYHRINHRLTKLVE